MQPAEAEVQRCTMARPLGIEPGPRPPLAHYAATVGTVAWLPRRVRSLSHICCRGHLDGEAGRR
jgi:hypothetical protein